MSDAAKIVTLAPKPITLSNLDFLKGVFGANSGRAHVTGFKPDPSSLVDRKPWSGGAASGLLPFHTDWNTFFTISVFHPDPVDGRYRRRKVSFDRCHCIVIDDVNLRNEAGTSAKVGADRVKLDPSWVLETSPGNYQLGYILEGGDARGGKVAALLDALVASGLVPDGSDPGMKGVTRYVRLPVGRNTKAKYGTAGFDHVLASWHPSRTYSLEDVADAYDVRGAIDAAEDDLGSAGAGATFVPGEETLWNAILGSGTAHSVDTQKNLIQVTCPFVDDHTGRADSGTAYLGGGRWVCNHGHCVDRTFGEFTDKFRENHPDAWKEAVRDSFVAQEAIGDEGVAPSVREQEVRDLFGDETVDAAIEQAETEKVVGKGASRFFWMEDAAAGGALLDMEWLVKGLIPSEGLGVLYGPPGTGKSFVALDLAARIASGLDWQGLRVKKTGMVLYVASEGGTQSLRNRAVAWTIGNGGRGAGPVLVFPGALRLGRGAAEGAADRVAGFALKQAASAGVGVSMVVVDTLARNMLGDENTAADMGEFVAACDRIVALTGAFVLLVHHSGKDAGRGARGSSSLLSAVDLGMELSREPGLGNPGTLFVTKAREGDLVGRTFWYLLKSVDFGKDADGDKVTSLYVEETAPKAAAPKPLGAYAQALKRVYDDLVGPGNWCNSETLVKTASEWSYRGEFEKIMSGKGVPPAKFREKLASNMGDLGWVNSPDNMGVKEEIVDFE